MSIEFMGVIDHNILEEVSFKDWVAGMDKGMFGFQHLSKLCIFYSASDTFYSMYREHVDTYPRDQKYWMYDRIKANTSRKYFLCAPDNIKPRYIISSYNLDLNQRKIFLLCYDKILHKFNTGVFSLKEPDVGYFSERYSPERI